MVKLVIFDLDGTLVDAYRAIEKSLNFTLRKLGYPKVSYAMARRAVGLGDLNFIKRFFKKEDIKKALEIYRRDHSLSLLKHSRLMPGAKDILSFLKKRGYKLAIASNRPKKFTNILLDHLRLKDYFDLVVCGKNKEDIKPSPKLLLTAISKLRVKKREAIYIGDMTIDVCAGRNAGIRTFAVTTGSSSRIDLQRAGPFKIIKRLHEIKNKIL